MATLNELRELVGRLERASRQVVWETPFEKSAGLAGLYESAGAFARPPGVAYHGLALGRDRSGIVVEAFANCPVDRALTATRKVSSLLGIPAQRVRLVPCESIVSQIRAGTAGGHAVLVGQGSFGTIGGFASDLQSELVLAVSNNHVFANANAATIGDPLVESASGTQFGALHRYQPLLAQPAVNDLDGAVGWIDASRRLQVPRAMKIVGAGQPKLGMRVRKWGATTGYTEGRIRSLFGSPVITYPGFGVVNFRSCLRIEGTRASFSEPGDSGSLVLDDHGLVVGIVFAGEAAGRFSLANPVAPLTGRLGIAF